MGSPKLIKVFEIGDVTPKKTYDSTNHYICTTNNALEIILNQPDKEISVVYGEVVVFSGPINNFYAVVE